MTDDLPPLPPGATLDAAPSGLPPLPEGATLDAASMSGDGEKPGPGWTYAYGKWREPGWFEKAAETARAGQAQQQYEQEGTAAHLARAVLNGGLLGWGAKAIGAVESDRLGIPAEQVAKSERQRQEEFRSQHPVASLGGNLLGGAAGFAVGVPALEATPVVGPAIGAAGNVLGRIRDAYGWAPAAAATGAAIGAPVGAIEAAGHDESMLAGAAKGAIGGAVAGPLVEGGVRGVAATVAPWVSDYMQRSIAAGARPTVGEMFASENTHLTGEGGNVLGRMLKMTEDVGAGFPVSGAPIRGMQNTSREVFNRDMINRILEPINETLAPTTHAGRDQIREAGNRLSNAYDTLVPTIRGQVDQRLRTEMGRLRDQVPAALRGDFDTTIQRIVYSKQNPATGQLTGRSFKDAEGEMRQTAVDYMASGMSTASERQLGRVLGQARDALFAMMDRHNPPQVAERLRDINHAYSMLIPVERAAASVGAQHGVFTSAQLFSALKAVNQTARKRGIARGTANLQRDIEAAKEAMTQSIPNSGTPGRLEMGGGLAAVMAGHPEVALGPFAAAGAIYNPLTHYLIRNAATVGAGPRQETANILRELAPRAGIIGGQSPEMQEQLPFAEYLSGR